MLQSLCTAEQSSAGITHLRRWLSLEEQKSKNIYLSLVVLWANILICVTDPAREREGLLRGNITL